MKRLLLVLILLLVPIRVEVYAQTGAEVLGAVWVPGFWKAVE